MTVKADIYIYIVKGGKKPKKVKLKKKDLINLKVKKQNQKLLKL